MQLHEEGFKHNSYNFTKGTKHCGAIKALISSSPSNDVDFLFRQLEELTHEFGLKTTIYIKLLVRTPDYYKHKGTVLFIQHSDTYKSNGRRSSS